jgi:flagellar secretion chaperone FliS
MSASYFNQYRNNQINTASPEQLLIMLYDGAIRFINEASQHLSEGRIAPRGTAIGKAMAIISELAATLDHEIGGEIAGNLAALYDYMLRELTQANLHDDPQRLESVRSMLAGLRETWMAAIEKHHAEQAEARGAGTAAGKSIAVAL